MGFHFVNFALEPAATIQLFSAAPWFSGTFITFSMIIIYSGAQNRVKRGHYEIFWISHHFFAIFFVLLLAHGPIFWAWSVLPVVGYVLERIFRISRGNNPFYLRTVKFVSPVMQLSFFPDQDRYFEFREGQYLYLKCGKLAEDEWHPFTISSAHEDLTSYSKDKGKEITVHIRVQAVKVGGNFDFFMVLSPLLSYWIYLFNVYSSTSHQYKSIFNVNFHRTTLSHPNTF